MTILSSLRTRRPPEKARGHASISTLASVFLALSVSSTVRVPVRVRGDAIHNDADATSGTTTAIDATNTISSVGECDDASSSSDNRDGKCRNAPPTDYDSIEIQRNGKTRDDSEFGPAKPSKTKVNVKWEEEAEEATPSYYLNAFKIKEGNISTASCFKL